MTTPPPIFANWRNRRNCFPHDYPVGRTWIKTELIDLSRHKAFRCIECGRMWFV